MDFAAWTQTGHDPLRVRRFVLGYGVGAVSVALVATFITLSASGVSSGDGADDEGVRDVQFATEPEPEPEPEIEKLAPKPKPALPKLRTPTLIPKDAPEEADAKTDSPDDGNDPYMLDDGSAAEEVEPAAKPEPKPEPKPIVKAKPAPKPALPKPVRVTENMTQPKCTIPPAAYPESAKSQGIEGTVLVRFVVTESGAILGVKAVRGPAELRAASEAAIRAATCQPAMMEGSPITVFQARPFRFRLKM